MNLHSPIARLRAGSAERWLRLLLVASIALPLVLLGVVAWHDYDESVLRSGERVERTTRIAREHALKVFETNDIILRRVFDLLGADADDALAAREDEIHGKLREIAQGVPQIQEIAVWSAEGRPLASSQRSRAAGETSIADSDYFRAVQMDGEHLVISDSMNAKAGDGVFVMARRRDDADGRFAGAVTIALSPSTFLAFYEQVAGREPEVSVALARPDASVVTRYPDAPAPRARLASHNPLIPLMNGEAATPVSLAISPEDGKRRYVMAQRVGAYPLFVDTSLTQSAVVAEWLRKLWLPAAVALAAALALFLVTWIALRKTRREQAAVAQLKDEAARRASAERMLTHLSQHLIRLSETEKAKLAAELHDELGGALSALALDIAWVLERLKTVAPELEDRQRQALKLVQDTAVLKRRIIDGLRPMLLQHLGLAAALRDYVGQWSKKTGIPVDLRVDDDMPALPSDAALALFRVVQESLTNVAKYAKAKAVAVHAFAAEDGVNVTVTDDGVGIAAETLQRPTSHGITGMQQRVAPFSGSFAVSSSPGKGTRVTARIPIPADRSVVAHDPAIAGA